MPPCVSGSSRAASCAAAWTLACVRCSRSDAVVWSRKAVVICSRVIRSQPTVALRKAVGVFEQKQFGEGRGHSERAAEVDLCRRAGVRMPNGAGWQTIGQCAGVGWRGDCRHVLLRGRLAQARLAALRSEWCRENTLPGLGRLHGRPAPLGVWAACHVYEGMFSEPKTGTKTYRRNSLHGPRSSVG